MTRFKGIATRTLPFQKHLYLVATMTRFKGIATPREARPNPFEFEPVATMTRFKGIATPFSEVLSFALSVATMTRFKGIATKLALA